MDRLGFRLAGHGRERSPPAAWAPPFPVRAGSRARDLATLSIAVSVGTLVFFVDLFAPFTSPIALVLAVSAWRRSDPESAERSRSKVALALGLATIGIWFLMIPVYNAMNEGL